MKFEYGAPLPALAKAPFLSSSPYTAANLTGDYGFLHAGSGQSNVQDNHPKGSSMWCLENRTQDFDIVFDLQGVYPVGEMWVWNYNPAPTQTQNRTVCGIRQAELFYSLNEIHWHSAGEPVIFAKADGTPALAATNLVTGKPFDFGGVCARYLKLHVRAVPGLGNYDEQNTFAGSFGLSKVRFYMGQGYAVVPDDAWNGLFARTQGWTGSDGVFTIPMNERETYAPGTNTTITFGDTLIDTLEPETLRRSKTFHMLHNSACFVPGGNPAGPCTFLWGRDANGGDESLLCPPLSVQNDVSRAGYYWPQDSFLCHGKCYTYLLTVLDWPEGPEGFQFKVDGVAMAVSPVENGQIAWQKAKHFKTNLYNQSGAKSIFYGGCVLPCTERAGHPQPDGYVYLLGTIHEGEKTQLCIARTLEQSVENGESWQFYNGEGWCADIAQSAPLADRVSCEMSLSLVTGRLHQGEYLLVYQQDVNSPVVAYRTAPTPWGPYSAATELYFTPEVLRGQGRYTYNAKAHPHLAPSGEYLISYNTNTTAWEMHEAHGDLCRPSFLRVKEIVK